MLICECTFIKKEGKIMADAKLLATIERSETEQLQISLSEYKGTSYLNMRIFFTNDGGATWKSENILMK